MTINLMESIKKMMGWCPNSNGFATKRVMVTLPSDEGYGTDKEEKSGQNKIKKISDQAKVSVVTAVCLLGLTAVLKNALHVPADVLSDEIIFYILSYSIYATSYYIYYPPEAKRSKYDTPLIGSLVIVLITIAIIVIHLL